MRITIARFWFPIFGVFILTMLVIFGIYGIVHKNPDVMAAKMCKDLEQLVVVLQKVDKDCSIVSIDSGSGVIDFLTIEKLLGVDAGCLMIAYPEKWAGPYLKKDLMYQGAYYEIVQTNHGFYIVPGNGVRLPNGFVMGQDLEINSKIEIEPLLKPGARLCYKNNRFAMPLDVHKEGFDVSKKTIEAPDALLKEFNAVMPFAKNCKEPIARHVVPIKRQC